MSGDGILVSKDQYDFNHDDRLFYDLLAYCPGMSNSLADVLAVLEAEAPPSRNSLPGTIDPAARELFDKVRSAGWQKLTLNPEADAGRVAKEHPAADAARLATIIFDGAGRYTYERTLPLGLKERVVCDGKTLLHLYPDLGIGARRTVSRFHRSEFAGLIPWVVPPAEDLARGADLKVVGERTVALIPHGAESAKDADGKPLTYSVGHLVFAENGRLAEQQIVEMPSKKVLLREIIGADGVVKLLNADGKELAVSKGKLSEAKEPNLTPLTPTPLPEGEGHKLVTPLTPTPLPEGEGHKLVVLPLPYRSPEHVRKTLKIENKQLGDLRFEEAMVLFASEFGSQNANEANNVFRQSFHNRDQRQIGFYVLLAACGNNLDAEYGDVLSEHSNEPLAQYLALYSSPVLRKHASQWAVSTGQWEEGFLQHLAVTHALYHRWQSDKVHATDETELKRALDYVRRNATPLSLRERGRGERGRGEGGECPAFALTLLGLMQDRANAEEAQKKDVKSVFRALADAWLLFEGMPGMSYSARYENARCLWKAGESDRACKLFRELYEKTLQDDVLPAIDADFRQALLGNSPHPNPSPEGRGAGLNPNPSPEGRGAGLKETDQWSDLLHQTAKHLVDKKHRLALLLIARQCWQLSDQPMADQLLAAALDGITDDKERQGMTLVAIDFLMGTSQWPRADQLLQGLLADEKLARKSGLWRMGATLAEKHGLTARELECLEQALALEYQNLPDVINLEAIRRDYGRLLRHYENLAEAMVTLKTPPPPDFLPRVIRTADRWRALDSNSSDACQSAARILQTLGERDLGWDYLTTPVAQQPNEAGPWVSLAQTLSSKGELDLADRAYGAAFEAEPTNAQILWDRAQQLQQAGKQVEAQKLFRQLADTDWQPRFNWLKSRAKSLVISHWSLVIGH